MNFKDILLGSAKKFPYTDGIRDFRQKTACKYREDPKYFEQWQEGYSDALWLHEYINGPKTD